MIVEVPDELWWDGIKISCDHCDTKITLEKQDKPARGFVCSYFYTVICPTCGTAIPVGEYHHKSRR